MSKQSNRTPALSIQERAALAMDAALRKAIEEHAREGLPMYVWRDEKVVAVPAEELLKKA
ncbi:MAG TPA: hypothetical protein VGF20_09400 [Candidatus Acidoferrum sp.]|jgi:hypothetical protein